MLSCSKGYPRCGLLLPGPSIDGVGAPDEAASACQGEAGEPIAGAKVGAKDGVGRRKEPGARVGGEESGDRWCGGDVTGELKKGGGSRGVMAAWKFGIVPGGPARRFAGVVEPEPEGGFCDLSVGGETSVIATSSSLPPLLCSLLCSACRSIKAPFAA